MRRSLFLIIFFTACGLLPGQTVKTIGTTNNGSRELPFGMYYGYERSASLYLKSEINNTFCNIIALGWQVQAGNLEICPVKIYLKLYNSTILSSTTWDAMKDGATLVYDASTNFPAGGWQTIDIADFTYYSGTSSTNLLVLCEANYGSTPPSNYPWFYYSNTTTGLYRHEYWRNNGSPPAGNGTIDLMRPNIQITYLPISSHNPPSAFMATAVSPTQVNLSWTRNSANDNVMVAYNTVNTFGNPSGSYVPGDNISGGGTVIYNGSGTSWSQTTGLSPATTYYYMAWSVYSSPPSYSSGTSASATTLCEPTGTFPYLVDFEPVNFPPTCWALAGKPWTRSTAASGYGTGSASSKADFFNISSGNFDLVSPVLDISSLTGPVIKFDHAYATASNEADSLTLWYSTDNGASYILLHSWLGGLNGPLNTGGATSSEFIPASNQWATKSHPLPSGTNKVMFRGVSAYGNNLYIDNISIYDTACGTGSIPFFQDFDLMVPPSTGCFPVTNNNNDGIAWMTSASFPRSSPNSMYISQNGAMAMNDWFFTPGLNLDAGKVYLLVFHYRNSGPSFPEKLEVKWGTAPNSQGMTGGLLWDDQNIQTAVYQPASATFSPLSDGVYYLGWHGYSAANMQFLCVDDISVCEAVATWNGSVSSDWNNPLNWTPGLIPNAYQSVVIPQGMLHDPVINAASLSFMELTINSGATVTVSGNSTISVAGDIIIQNGGSLNNSGMIRISGNLDVQE